MTDAQNLDSSLQQEITAIALNFPLFACFDCAKAIQSFLTDRNIPGKQIILSTGTTQKPFCNIYCDTLQQNISSNGRHTAIVIKLNQQELVFDNIHTQGVPKVEWINSFYSAIQDLGQNFQITETEF